jgi:hypothetical protein
MSVFEKETYLLLGGAGMVGFAVAREIAGDRELNAHEIVICGVTQEEVNNAVERLRREFPTKGFEGVAGDVFVRSEWNPAKTRTNPLRRAQLLESDEHRKALIQDVFGEFKEAYPVSEIVRLILDKKPAVIIDSINTATAFSYQDVDAASEDALKKFDELDTGVGQAKGEAGEDGQRDVLDAASKALDKVIISQSIPQLVRHVRLIYDAMKDKDVKTRLYLKIGTTGTGGMGLNVPYTHSEESPSATLMEKTAVAFAHTGLLYLMARTLGGPAVKEFKPAAMIGYADIGYRKVKVKANGKVGQPGTNMKLYVSAAQPLAPSGDLRLRPANEEAPGYVVKDDLELPLVNTGENGLFTKGEFQTITTMRQMEFITPEEIARQVVLEIKGSNTGYDVIAAIDGASMNPTYRAGYLRHAAIEELKKLEKDSGVPSVVLGELGPPQLGKLLWEAYLLHKRYEKVPDSDENELEKVMAKTKEELADELYQFVMSDENLRNTIVSVGLPILAADGDSLLLIRGPYLRVPQKNSDEVTYKPEDIDKWANRGWVDLRPQNMERWKHRFEKMHRPPGQVREWGSAAFTREGYVGDVIRIGIVVGWIFNNEFDAYRIK